MQEIMENCSYNNTITSQDNFTMPGIQTHKKKLCFVIHQIILVLKISNDSLVWPFNRNLFYFNLCVRNECVVNWGGQKCRLKRYKFYFCNKI